jgi:hypothetical protein
MKRNEKKNIPGAPPQARFTQRHGVNPKAIFPILGRRKLYFLRRTGHKNPDWIAAG